MRAVTVPSFLVPSLLPDAHSEELVHALRALPAYVALGVAAGAGSYALAHFITVDAFTVTLYSVLCCSLGISYGSLHGNPAVRRAARGSRWLLLGILLPLMALSNPDLLAPPDSRIESQQIEAVLMGWGVIVSVLMAGSTLGGQEFPLTAALVPALSLFGVLNTGSVDTVIGIAFLVFVAASLYLVAYERMLRRKARHDTAREALRETAGTARLTPTPDAGTEPADAIPLVGHTAARYMLACSAWFGLFVLGGIVLYYPMQAVLPGVRGVRLGATSRASQVLYLDWRGSGDTMDLPGGYYAPSDRAILRITLEGGQSPGLWRGRVYTRYQGSRWADPDRRTAMEEVPVSRDALTDLGHPLPALPARWGSRTATQALLEPLAPTGSTLFTPGEPVALQDAWDVVLMGPARTLAMPPDAQLGRPYRVRAVSLDISASALPFAAGLTRQELMRWRTGASTATTLELPQGADGERLLEIARQITAQARSRGQAVDTPYRKAVAVSQYLTQTCTYSLISPVVPASEDAVLFFLTNSQQGACDMFASSEALLLRAMNVPARIATGYLEPDAEPGSNGAAFIARDRDAHAWVEYYVPAAGWLSYDATVGTRTTEVTLPTRLAAMLRLQGLRVQWRMLLLPCLGLLLLLAGGIWSAHDLRQGRLIAGDASGDPGRARITAVYGEAVRVLERARVPRAPQQTPQEYETTVDRASLHPDVKQEFAALTFLYTQAHYSATPARSDPEQLRECLRRLRRQLRQSKQ